MDRRSRSKDRKSRHRSRSRDKSRDRRDRSRWIPQLWQPSIDLIFLGPERRRRRRKGTDRDPETGIIKNIRRTGRTEKRNCYLQSTHCAMLIAGASQNRGPGQEKVNTKAKMTTTARSWRSSRTMRQRWRRKANDLGAVPNLAICYCENNRLINVLNSKVKYIW